MPTAFHSTCDISTCSPHVLRFLKVRIHVELIVSRTVGLGVLAYFVMELSLERISVLLTHLPPYTLPTIHITGTNGKGSVSSFVASILQASGFTVGRFNSPHLVSVLDSIIINGEPASPDLYNGARRMVEDVDSKFDVAATSFELLTATALMIFESAKPDIIILEVGMGGRTDATNVISDDCILVSALTSVDLDHQKFLGETVGEIATQKAGIARRGRPFVIGPQKHPEVLGSVRTVIENVGADLVHADAAIVRPVVDEPVTPSPSPFHASALRPISLFLPYFSDLIDAQLPLHGDHQLDNLGVAGGIISSLLSHPSSIHRLPFQSKITPSTIAAGVRSTTWIGRLSFHDVPLSRLCPQRVTTDSPEETLTVLVDGAHNPSSASVLASYMSRLFESANSEDLKLVFLLALSHSPPKTPLQTLSPLLSFKRPTNMRIRVSAAALEFTPVEGMPWVRPVPCEVIREAIRDIDGDINVWIPKDEEQSSVANALLWAHGEEKVNSGNALVCLAGSLYLVADFYRLYIG
jgi:folylpolyglutamate synthase/dihydrofolate synthase